MPKKLTHLQKSFVDHWTGNIAETERIMRDKGITIGKDYGKTLIAKKHVLNAIKRRNKKNPEIATREERQKFWTDVIRGEIKSQVVIGRGDDRQVVDVDPSLNDRNRASELLGKSEGDFIDIKADVTDNKLLDQLRRKFVDLDGEKN